jgi:hypothetical protein
VFGCANSDTDGFADAGGKRNSDTVTHSNAAANWSSSDATAGSGLNIYFFDGELPMELRKRDRLRSARWQHSERLRYLRPQPDSRSFGDGEQYADGWAHDLRAALFQGQ